MAALTVPASTLRQAEASSLDATTSSWRKRFLGLIRGVVYDLPIAVAKTQTRTSQLFGTGSQNAIPRNAFGRAEDEITSDFPLAQAPGEPRTRPRASDPPTNPDAGLAPWQPLTDDEATGEALLEKLKEPEEKTPEGERGPGRPGLN